MSLTEIYAPSTQPPISHDLFVEAAEVSLHPDVRLVGSVARAAITGTQLDNYRPSGLLRDIDLVRLGERGDVPAVASGRDVDVSFERWITPDGSHLVFPYNPSLQVAVKHPEVFAPYEVNVDGNVIRTLHPDVLGKLNTMQLVQRPKDKKSAAVYDTFLAGRTDRMDPELLEPFATMRAELGRQYGYRAKGALRYAYHRAIPEAFRKKFQISSKLPGLRPKPDGGTSAQ